MRKAIPVRVALFTLIGLTMSFSALAQGAYWQAVNEEGFYETPEQACYESHQSYSANSDHDITPNYYKLSYSYKTGEPTSMVCGWDRGEPGYWGTTGFTFLRCPAGTSKTDDDNRCGEPALNSCEKAGNPIDILSGAKTQTETDFVVGRGRLKFTRTYNSNKTDATALGKGWSSNFHPQVGGNFDWYYGYFTYRLESGHYIRFRLKGFGANAEWVLAGVRPNTTSFSVYSPRNDLAGYDLIQNSSTSLTLKEPSGVERDFVFPSAASFDINLSKIRYPDGYEIDLVYDVDGMLESVTDTDGYTIGFAYNDKGELSQVTAPDGSIYRYEYEHCPTGHCLGAGISFVLNSGWIHYAALSKVIYPDDTPLTDEDNPEVTYFYEDPQYYIHLTGRADERGIRMRWWDYEWGGSGWRAISSAGPEGRENTLIEKTPNLPEVTVTNALGKEAHYTYQNIGNAKRLISIDGMVSPNCAASTSSVGYNSYGLETSRTDREGQVTTRIVDSSENLPTSITRGAGTAYAETTDIVWDTTLRKPTQLVRTGLTTDLVYDANWNLTELKLTDTTSHTVPYSTNGETRTWNYVWGAGGLLMSVDGPRSGPSDTIHFTYDAYGNLATVTDAVGLITTVNSVDGMGRPTQITNSAGLVTNMAYTPRGWVESIVLNPGTEERATHFTYDAAGNLTRIDYPNGGWVTYVYDQSAWLTQMTASAGEKTLYEYDLLGNVTRVDYTDLSETSSKHAVMSYDELGRVIELLGGAGDLWQFSYDRSDRLVSETDGLGRSWLRGFDALNRVISQTDPELDEQKLDWGHSDDLSQFTDARSLSTIYVRNGFGDVIRETSPDRSITDYWYDDAGQLVRRLDAEGHDNHYAYDAAGRIVSETYPDQPSLDLTYVYDDTTAGNAGDGRLTEISGGASNRTYAYDVFGDLTEATIFLDAHIYGLAFEYSSSGELDQMTLPSGRELHYSHDNQGRIIGISTRPGSSGGLTQIVSSIERAPMGPITGLIYGNGVSAEQTLDSSYRLTGVNLTFSATSLLEKAISYNATGRISAIDDGLDPAASATYTYHLDGRLKRATGPWGDVEWAYDPVGNRISGELYVSGSSVSTDTYTYPATSNRLSGIVDDSNTPIRSLTYSADGDINQDIRPSGEVFTYTYNEAGRLETVLIDGLAEVSYKYDAYGHRVWRDQVGEGVQHFVFAPSGQLLGEYNGGTGQVIAEYIWLGDQLVAEVDGAGTVRYVQTGHLGQPLVLMDQTANVVWRGETSPFGTYVYTSGVSDDPKARFLGQWLEEGSGLYQNWNRDYDAALGRYIEVDPLGILAGQSVYGYVDQDPLLNVDPTGELAWLAVPLLCSGGGCEAAIAALAAIGCTIFCDDLISEPLNGTIDNKIFSDTVFTEFGDQAGNICRAPPLAYEPLSGNPRRLHQCLAAASGTDEDWQGFCDTIPWETKTNVLNGGPAKLACEMMYSETGRRNWCYNQYGD
ncbi:RHS repeat-associated core domain-containing protein [Hyphomonas beringensis]|nr:RHS repeat-associated core domain-containing protein [Hyphomonas beringensis]